MFGLFKQKETPTQKEEPKITYTDRSFDWYFTIHLPNDEKIDLREELTIRQDYFPAEYSPNREMINNRFPLVESAHSLNTILSSLYDLRKAGQLNLIEIGQLEVQPSNGFWALSVQVKNTSSIKDGVKTNFNYKIGYASMRDKDMTVGRFKRLFDMMVKKYNL